MVSHWKLCFPEVLSAQAVGKVGPPAPAVVRGCCVRGGPGASGYSSTPVFPIPGGQLAVLGRSQCVQWVDVNLSWSHG